MAESVNRAKALLRINESGRLKKRTRPVVAVSSYTISRDCTRPRNNTRALLFAIACDAAPAKAEMTQQQPRLRAAAQLASPSTLKSQSAGESGQQVGSGSKGFPQGPNDPRLARLFEDVSMSNEQLHRHIFQSLQSQGPFSGWQASTDVPERAAPIRQIVDSLRLVSPPVELPKALELAIQFEHKAFAQSASKGDYLRECKDKLARIREQRVRQMDVNSDMGTQQGISVSKHSEGLSAEDNQIINSRAAELAKAAPKEKMRSIVEGMQPQLRASLEAKGVDPIIYYFRMMATREFRRESKVSRW